MESFGTPGGSLTGQQAKYGRGKTSAGLDGEVRTAKMLDRMFRKAEDVVCFHDVNIPNAKANADHVIVRGNKVVVIDSKSWSPGFYWTMGGTSRRGWSPYKPADSKTVPMAVDRIAKHLQGTGAEVVGIVAVHKSRPGIWSMLLLRPHSRTLPAGRAFRATRQLLGDPAEQNKEILKRIWRLTK